MCQAKSDYRMLWVQLSGVKWGSGPGRGVEVGTVPVVDPVFSGDLALRGENGGNPGRAIP